MSDADVTDGPSGPSDGSNLHATLHPFTVGVWGVLMFWVLLSACAAWGVSEWGMARWIPADPTVESGRSGATDAAYFRRDQLTCVLTLGTLGGLLALGFGLAGATRTSATSKEKAVVVGVGVLLGLAVPAAAGWIVAPIFQANEIRILDEKDALLPLLIHLGMYIPPALFAGLSLVWATRGFAATGKQQSLGIVLLGVVGAIVGTILYDVIGAVVLPTSVTERPIAGEPLARALAPVLVALFAAAGILLGFSRQKPSEP